MTDNKDITNFVNITNLCINLGYWSLYFKKPIAIIIPKPNQLIYNFLKAFLSRSQEVDLVFSYFLFLFFILI